MVTTRTIHLTLPRLHREQQAIKEQAVRFNVICAGRRFGKDVLMMDRIIQPALEGQPVAWFSPSYPMHTEVWRALKNLLQPVTSRVDAQQYRLELITGGTIDMWSLAAAASTRGRKYKRVVINEAAMVPALQEAWEAVIRPTLTDLEGDAWFGSTPDGRNYFHTLYLRGLSGVEGWRSWHKPSSDNPFLPPTEIEAARRDLPEDVFRQEYLAEFLEGEGSVFRNIRACLTSEPTTPEQHKGHKIVGGLDWAQLHDYTVLSVVCETCRRELDLLRFNKIEWDFQRDKVVAAYRKWGITELVAELNSIGSPNIEALQKKPNSLRVEGFKTTAESKPQIIKSLVLCLEQVECKWLDIAVATGELEAYESKVNPVTGRVTYSAPDGVHDDTVIARALAWYGIAGAQSKRMVIL